MKKINLKSIFSLFIILQPIFDCSLLYSDEVIDFFGFSPSTILRMLIISIFTIIVFFKYKNLKQFIIIYGIITAIYFVIHHFIGVSIDNSAIYHTFKYSLSDEVFYLFRMLMPVGVIYIIYNLNYTKEDLKNIIKYSSIIIILILIISNLTKTSLTSYDENIIYGSIFDWFNSGIDRRLLASKGWFNSANQISATILIHAIVLTYYTITENKKNLLIITILLILSSMMIGTRTATTILIYSIVILVVSLLCANFIFKTKELNVPKYLIYSSIIIAFSLMVYGVAPIAHCEADNNYQCLFVFDSGLYNLKQNELPSDLSYDENTICEFIDRTPTHPQYYRKIYPCEENREFWNYYAEEKIYKRANNRTMEVIIGKDVYDKIKSPMISLFGMSRSRLLSAEFYIEKDFYVHYYTMGIFGTIILLVIPYIIPLIIAGYTYLKAKHKDSLVITLAYTTAIILFVSYLSGHVLDELIVTIYLGLVIGVFLKITNDIQKT